MTTKTETIIITGIVQGVGMRYFIQQTARRLGLGGYVKNEPDGRVKCVVKGPEKTVNKLVNTIENHSPGDVTDITRKVADETVESLTFNVRL